MVFFDFLSVPSYLLRGFIPQINHPSSQLLGCLGPIFFQDVLMFVEVSQPNRDHWFRIYLFLLIYTFYMILHAVF